MYSLKLSQTPESQQLEILDAEGSISVRLERLVYCEKPDLEMAYTIVQNWRGFAVHDSTRRSYYPCTKGLSYTLVAHTHTKNGVLTPEVCNYLKRYP